MGLLGRGLSAREGRTRQSGIVYLEVGPWCRRLRQTVACSAGRVRGNRAFLSSSSSFPNPKGNSSIIPSGFSSPPSFRLDQLQITNRKIAPFVISSTLCTRESHRRIPEHFLPFLSIAAPQHIDTEQTATRPVLRCFCGLNLLRFWSGGNCRLLQGRFECIERTSPRPMVFFAVSVWTGCQCTWSKYPMHVDVMFFLSHPARIKLYSLLSSPRSLPDNSPAGSAGVCCPFHHTACCRLQLSCARNH